MIQGITRQKANNHRVFTAILLFIGFMVMPGQAKAAEPARFETNCYALSGLEPLSALAAEQLANYDITFKVRELTKGTGSNISGV